MVTQSKRLKILDDFKNGKFRVLVATDVASRGLHIEDVQLVVNYDIPMDPETYVHRIGRTARAGKTGRAISISSEFDYDALAKLERYLKYKIPVVQPEPRYLENLSFVRIVQSDRQDGSEHIRGERRRARADRSARDHKGHVAGQGARREARGSETTSGEGRKPRTRSAHGAAQHHKQKDASFTNARRVHRSEAQHGLQGRRRKRNEKFTIVPRSPEKAGLFARIVRSLKALFTRKPATPQISERTRRLLEQETRGGRGDVRRGKSKRRGRGGKNRRGRAREQQSNRVNR
jgi:ATP-dependent RNA helicase RhlB